jgi:hypothetical protein
LRDQSPNSLFNSKKNLQPPLATTVASVSEHAFASVRKLAIRAVSNLQEGIEIVLRGTAVVGLRASLEITVVEGIPLVIRSVSFFFQTYKYLDSPMKFSCLL